MSEIDEAFRILASMNEALDKLKSEYPQIQQVEKDIEVIKDVIQKYAKAHGDCTGFGYACTVSTRDSWDTKALNGFAAAYPELTKLKSQTITATIRKVKK